MTSLETQLQDPPADPVRERVRATWTVGDFDRIAVAYEPGAAAFVDRLNLAPGEAVLDVACGTGNLTLPAARAGARVAGIDIAPLAIEHLVKRADVEGLAVDARVGDAEALPYADASFDTVITMYGAMFAGHPDRTAEELLRVTRAGGRIAMANWTPEGFVGLMLKATVKYLPPPPGVPSTLLWGVPRVVEERMGQGARAIEFTRRPMVLDFPMSPEGTVALFRKWYGPTVRAFGALDQAGQAAYFDDLVALWTEYNTAGSGRTRVESEYLEVIVTRA